MSGKETGTNASQEGGIIQVDGGFTMSKAELVAQVGSYTIFRNRETDIFIEYDAIHSDGNEYLHLESYAAVDESSDYFTGYWDGSVPLAGFLAQIDGFFTQHIGDDLENALDVDVAIAGDEGMMIYGGERPVTSDDLVAAEGVRIGSEAERLNFLRIENNFAAFTWERDKVGFIVTPTRFPDQAAMRSSLIEIYDSSNPVVPTDVFQTTLDTLISDAAISHEQNI